MLEANLSGRLFFTEYSSYAHAMVTKPPDFISDARLNVDSSMAHPAACVSKNTRPRAPSSSSSSRARTFAVAAPPSPSLVVPSLQHHPINQKSFSCICRPLLSPNATVRIKSQYIYISHVASHPIHPPIKSLPKHQSI